jgi:outer membrane protein OmpA-like peptidoglycan-associated protein
MRQRALSVLLLAALGAGGLGCGSSAPVSSVPHAEAASAVAEARRAVERAEADPDLATDLAAPFRALAAAEAALAAGDTEEAAHRAYLARQGVRVAALEAEVEAAERAVAAVEAEGGRRLLITDAFETAQTDLRPAPRDAVDRVAAYLLGHPDRVVLVEGFTDSTGDEERNLDLSVRRAAAVKTRLVEAGVDEARVVTAGYGQAYPVASNETDEGRRQNRRIEITVADRLDALPIREPAPPGE